MPWRRACNPLQHPCLETAVDRAAWWATVHGVAKSQTRRSDRACTVLLTTPRLHGAKPQAPRLRDAEEQGRGSAGAVPSLLLWLFQNNSNPHLFFFFPTSSCFIYLVSFLFFFFNDWEPAIFQKHVCVY